MSQIPPTPQSQIPPTPQSQIPQPRQPAGRPGPSQKAIGKRKHEQLGAATDPAPTGGTSRVTKRFRTPAVAKPRSQVTGGSVQTASQSAAVLPSKPGGHGALPTGTGINPEPQPEAGPSTRPLRKKTTPVPQKKDPKPQHASDWHLRKSQIPAGAQKTKVHMFFNWHFIPH